MDGSMFLGHIQKHLLLTLKKADIVICDNLPAHKVKGVKETIKSVGAELFYLPAYSPDLNPIEMAFAKFKALLRDAAKRTWVDLLQAVAHCFDSFTVNDCRNFFHHCQYV